MEIKFIGQGYNLEANTSVAFEIIEALKNDDYSIFQCLVAFASFAGVSALSEHIEASKAHIDQHKIIVGIDHEGTSKEALEELLNWNVDAYIYYFESNRRNKPIYHPKIYMFKGVEKSQVIIGSNNFTVYGLTSNVEGAISIKYDNDENDNNQLINQIENYYESLLNLTDVNLKRITLEQIQVLHNTGDLPSDERRAERHEKAKLTPRPEAEVENEYPNLSDIFGVKAVQEPPAEFRPRRRARVNLRRQNQQNEAREEVEIIDENNWVFNDNNLVLIAEIGGPSRWKQISFAKRNFETFFEIPIVVGINREVRLKYLTDEAIVEDHIENCHAIVKASSNYNLEPSKVGECRVPYNRTNKPIIFFIKINATNFIYHFETHGTNNYTELQQALNGVNGAIRRRELTVERLREECPSLNL